MIEIKIEAANGAEARQYMLDLLGLSNTATLNSDNLNVAVSPKAELKETETTEVSEAVSQETKAEPTTRKRRSKAEIEAEKNAEATASETSTDDTPEEQEETQAETAEETTTSAEENEAPDSITADDLKNMCVKLGREGKRDEVKTLIGKMFPNQSISGAPGTEKIDPANYPALKAALEQL